jgi:hypothetical protein
MIHVNRYKRTSVLPAIAAALALSPTAVLAQEAQPVPTDPAPAAQPAPPTDPAPATTDTSTVAQPDSTSTDTAKPTATSTTKRVAHRTVAKASIPAARVATTRVTTRSVKAPAPAPARTTAAAAPASTPASTRPKPIVDLNAKSPAPTAAVAAKPAKKKDPTLPIAGGALAFLAIGGAAAAMSRRRHNEEEEWTVDPANAEPIDTAPADEPLLREEQPAIVAPSTITWEPAMEVKPETGRAEGETYVERAYRGPSPDNPSLSLRKRLKRAAFLDKRERDAAAGRALPVDATAGLPARMVEEQQERELDRA